MQTPSELGDDLEFISVHFDGDPDDQDECFIQIPDQSLLKRYIYIDNVWTFHGLVDSTTLNSLEAAESNKTMNTSDVVTGKQHISEEIEAEEKDDGAKVKMKDVKQILSLLRQKNVPSAISMLEMIISSNKKQRKPNPYNIFISHYMKHLKATEPDLNTHQRLASAVQAWKTRVI